MRWERLADEQVFRALVPLFEAVSFYRRQVHQDRTTAEVVLTRPGEPSLLEKALEEFGFRAGLMELTAEAFGDLAVSATKSLVVMTPFLDLHGGAWLAKLLKQAKPSVKKTLILRYVAQPAHPGHPEGLEAIRHAIADLSVQVFDYAIPRPTGGFETFHAKVVVSDDDYAYVGSANMNRASLEYSMELGVLLRGEAARRIAEILRAITRACGANA